MDRHSSRISLRQISRRLLAKNYAPAAVLIDRNHQILHALGAVGNYLNLPDGKASLDLLPLASPATRPQLRAAIQNVLRHSLPTSIPGGTALRGGVLFPYCIDILPAAEDPEPLLLICFVARPAAPPVDGEERPAGPGSIAPEEDLLAIRTQLHAALRELGVSDEKRPADSAETLAEREEDRPGLAGLSKWMAELQARAAELAAQNRQLRKALQAGQEDAATLRNIFHCIGLAILLLDPVLNIRCFTPEIEPFFRIIASDIGRPLQDLNYLGPDTELSSDSLEVLRGLALLEREIGMPDGRRFLRRIIPYREENGNIGGLILTFAEIAKAGPVAEPSQNARENAARRIASLTPRERQIMKMVVRGQPSKNIAIDLGISQRTVENHRAAIMRKTEARSLPTLARVAFASGLSDIAEPPGDSQE